MGAKSSDGRLWARTATYAFCHFAVDLGCIATVLGSVNRTLSAGGPTVVLLSILLYNLLAFCLQLPVGALLDRVGRCAPFAMASCGMVVVGALAALSPSASLCWAAVLLVAMGNAGFHCAGGLDVLEASGGRAAAPGAFIATGAAGVFLGGGLASLGAQTAALASAALLVGCMGLLDRMRAKAGTTCRQPPVLPAASFPLLGACALLALTVAIRSYAGMSMAFPWKADLVLAAALVAGVVAGKSTGGIVADRWGLHIASIVSLAGSAALFPLSWQLPEAGVLAAFLFNFTMPVTLSSLANLIPQSKGLAFGAASFSLAIGALPALLGYPAGSPWALSVLAADSLATLLGGLRLAERTSVKRGATE